VRGLALDLCHPLGIKVVEEPPNIKDLQSWEEVFISSTSRWVLPVGKVSPQSLSPAFAFQRFQNMFSTMNR